MLTDILLLFIVALLAAIFYLLTSEVKKPALEGSDETYKSKPIKPKMELADKYTKNGISEAVAKDFKKIIIEKMEIGEHYLNPDFKLDDLAKLISLSKHQTSLILNQELKMDFNSFVNSYRIQKATHLLSKGGKTQIGEVMYKVGFNNSTTFNRAFKKCTNLTPKEYVLNFVSKQC